MPSFLPFLVALSIFACSELRESEDRRNGSATESEIEYFAADASASPSPIPTITSYTSDLSNASPSDLSELNGLMKSCLVLASEAVRKFTKAGNLTAYKNSEGKLLTTIDQYRITATIAGTTFGRVKTYSLEANVHTETKAREKTVFATLDCPAAKVVRRELVRVNALANFFRSDEDTIANNVSQEKVFDDRANYQVAMGGVSRGALKKQNRVFTNFDARTDRHVRLDMEYNTERNLFDESGFGFVAHYSESSYSPDFRTTFDESWDQSHSVHEGRIAASYATSFGSNIGRMHEDLSYKIMSPDRLNYYLHPFDHENDFPIDEAGSIWRKFAEKSDRNFESSATALKVKSIFGAPYGATDFPREHAVLPSYQSVMDQFK